MENILLKFHNSPSGKASIACVFILHLEAVEKSRKRLLCFYGDAY
jgi:hypothetical protein